MVYFGLIIHFGVGSWDTLVTISHFFLFDFGSTNSLRGGIPQSFLSVFFSCIAYPNGQNPCLSRRSLNKVFLFWYVSSLKKRVLEYERDSLGDKFRDQTVFFGSSNFRFFGYEPGRKFVFLFLSSRSRSIWYVAICCLKKIIERKYDDLWFAFRVTAIFAHHDQMNQIPCAKRAPAFYLQIFLMKNLELRFFQLPSIHKSSRDWWKEEIYLKTFQFSSSAKNLKRNGDTQNWYNSDLIASMGLQGDENVFLVDNFLQLLYGAHWRKRSESCPTGA